MRVLAYCVLLVRVQVVVHFFFCVFFFQAEDGIRDLVRSRGLGDVYKRQTKAGLSDYQQSGGDDLTSRCGHPKFWRVRSAGQGLSLIHI